MTNIPMRPIRRILIAVAASAWTAALALLFGAVATGWAKGAETARAAPRLPITAQTYVGKSLNGNAGIHNYPWDYANSNGVKPDYSGPDTKRVADGVVMSGGDWKIRDCDITQIAGTGLVLGGTQGGVSLIGRASDVHVHSAINGVDFQGTDIQSDHINVDNIVNDAIMVNGGGNDSINTSHVSGAKRGYVFNQRVHCYDLGPDSTEDGIVLTGWSHGSVIHGVNIYQGTNWHRSVIIQSTCNVVTDINGVVRPADAAHPDIAACELMPGTLQNYVTGNPLVGRGSKGFIVNDGDCNELRITGGGWWDVDLNDPDPAKNSTDAVELVLNGKITRNKFYVTGHGDSGTVVESHAQLDESDLIDITWDGSATPIVGDTGKATVIIHEIKK